MQFTKIIKYIIPFVLVLVISGEVLSQENDSSDVIYDSDTTGVIKEKKGFHLFSIFKKNKEADDEEIDNDEETDTISGKKKRKGLFSFLKRDNKKDSVLNDSLTADSLIAGENDLKNKTEKDSAGGLSKPERITVFNWNKMDYTRQDSLLRAWDDYDMEFYKEKKRYKFTRKEVDIAVKLKKNRNLYEKFVYRRARKKPFKYKEKLINRKNKRYRKTLKFDRLDKRETEGGDSLSEKRRYEIVNRKYKREAKREAIRKNKVIIKYDRKEDRLRQRYELSDNEVIILNKGKGMKLKGTELVVFNRARKKQEKFTNKLLKYRKKRAYKLQNETVQKKIKEKNKQLVKRDKEQYSDLFNRKKKKRNDKHDSYEYPKRYHK